MKNNSDALEEAVAAASRDFVSAAAADVLEAAQQAQLLHITLQLCSAPPRGGCIVWAGMAGFSTFQDKICGNNILAAENPEFTWGTHNNFLCYHGDDKCLPGAESFI